MSDRNNTPRTASPAHETPIVHPTINPRTTSQSTRLSDMPAGAIGVVVRIDEKDHAMLIRLKTMGMHEGRAVRVVRSGNRIIVSCGGTRVGLSTEVARHVLVTPTA